MMKKALSRMLPAAMALRIMALCFLLHAALGFLPPCASAVPSNQKVWTFTQPDGTQFQAILRGDEFHAYHQTPDGKIVLQDPASGVWHFAIPQADGSLQTTSYEAGKSAVQTSALNSNLVPWLRAVEDMADARAEQLAQNFSQVERVPPTGLVKGVMLLANFSDTVPTFSQSVFTSLLNTPGYNSNGAMGSVRDYYLEASYGQFTLQTDVFGWFNLPHTRAYYGANDAQGNDVNPGQMIIDAINASDSTVNYANYDADGDGWVDFFGVIHQGQGEEQGGAPADCIWSHRSAIATKTVDGKKISDYHTDPEMFYSSLTTIGVICHESGHFFGLPDLYDTTYASEGVGNWSIMAGGSWCGPGGNGAKPCHFDPWCKMKLGWLTPTVITSPQAALALPAFDQSPTALLIPVDMYQDGEYFLVSNRYQRATGLPATGFDQYLPGSGALILHVDEFMPGNSNKARKKVDVEEADGLFELDNGVNRGSSGDLYPNGASVFSDVTNPNSRDNDGFATAISLSNFTGAGTANMTLNVTPRTLLGGTSIVYDSYGPYMALGYGDGDDTGCVRFTSATGGTLKRVSTYFNYSGTTNYTVSVYSGWSSNAPTGLLSTKSGTHTGTSFEEITLTTQPTIAPGTDFYVTVRYNTSGGYGWPLPLGKDNTPDGRGYVSNTGSSFTALTSINSGAYAAYDLNIRADLTPPAPAVVSIARTGSNPTAANSVSFLATFGVAVFGGSASNFSLTTTGGISGASVTGATGSGATRTVTVNTGNGSGTIRLDLANSTGLTDLYGQAVTSLPYTGGQSYTVDKGAQSVKNVTRNLYYNTLQAAVDDANAFDVIQAQPFTFNENVTINKSLFLSSSAGAASTILNGGLRFTSAAGAFAVRGFTINTGHDFGSGVAALQIDNSSSMTLENNILVGTGALGSCGILCPASATTNIRILGNEVRNWAAGVSLSGVTYLTLRYNNIHQNTIGLLTDTLSYSYLSGNLFDSNTQAGWRALNHGSNVGAELNSFLANGVGIIGVGGAVVDGRNNWWASASGPSGGLADPATARLASGSGNAVGSNVRFDPWLGGPNPTLTVTAPSAAASWPCGSTQTITWTSSQVLGNVKLFYSVAAGPWTQIAWDQPNTGSYSWRVNAPISSAVRIRVTAMNCNSIYGESGTFSVTSGASTPSITVTSPASGASVAKGSVQAIRWSSNAVTGNVKIFVSLNGGAWTSIAWDTPNDGAFDWVVTQGPSTNVKIRVTSMNNNAVYGDSALFSIVVGATITVTSPTTGDSLLHGTTQLIQWTSTGITGNVKIFLSNDGGPWESIGYDVPNTGQFSWKLKNYAATTASRIRITSMQNNALYGESNTFRIQ